MIRRSAFSGYFYPDDPSTLRAMLDAFYRAKDGPAEFFSREPAPSLLGVVSPHAGYQYSGPVAAWSFAALAVDTRVDMYVILGPSHRGSTTRVGLSGADYWETPLGQVAVDREAVAYLATHRSLCAIDDRAHAEEHSIEVQIPFLQYYVPGPWNILPLCLRDQGKTASLELSELLTELSGTKAIAIIASSDLTHYETEHTAREKDLPLIRLITSLKIDEFYRFLDENGVSACGPGSLAVLAGVQKRLAGSDGRLLCYETSGKASGDYCRVVGYASIVYPRSALASGKR